MGYKKIRCELFLLLDKMFTGEGKWAFVFPKAHTEEAKNKINGLHFYVKHTVMEFNWVNDANAAEDIACWFKPEAADLATGMICANSKVVTEEMLYQSKAIDVPEEVPWFVGTQGFPQCHTPPFQE